LGRIYAALAYYHDNREELDTGIRLNPGAPDAPR
jgi:hypothetical protein